MSEQHEDEVDSCGEEAEYHQFKRVSHDGCGPALFAIQDPDRLVPHKAHLVRGAEPQPPQAFRKSFENNDERLIARWGVLL